MFSRFFKWLDEKQPLSLLMSRLEVVGGFTLAVLAGLDWSQLVSMGTFGAIDWKAYAMVAAILVTRGVVYELARRFNTKDKI